MRYRIALALSVLLAGLVTPLERAIAVPVEGLYEAIVPGNSTEAGRAAAAADALRQVVVRVTGRSAAAADPGLQPLYDGSTKWVQTYRSVPGGQVAVSFDAALVDAALAKAGQHVWGRERPKVLAIVDGPVPLLPAARRDLQAAGLLRGLPVVFPETDAEPPADVREGRPEALQAVGRAFGAEVVLVVHMSAASVSSVWLGPGGAGSATGALADVFQTLADRIGAAQAVPVVENGRLLVVVHHVNDLQALVTVTTALSALPSVRSVTLESVVAATVKLRLGAGADAAGLRKALHDAGHFDVGEGGGPREIDLVYRP
jgi:hypothetical protein